MAKLSLDIDKYPMRTELPPMKISALDYLHLYGILLSQRAILFLNLRISLCNALLVIHKDINVNSK